jgi:hypothetical protein
MVPAPAKKISGFKLSKIAHYLIDNVLRFRLSQVKTGGQEQKWALRRIGFARASDNTAREPQALGSK